MIRPAPPDARGAIEVFMPDATPEQTQAVKAWPLRECRPRYEVPATRLLMALGERSASAMPAWSHLNPGRCSS